MKKIDKATLTGLIVSAVSARSKAYAPYSNHPVGAALLADDGITYTGCNVENAAYPLGFCAESNAIGNMIIGGAKTIQHIVIAGPGHHACMPCGGCRQQLREFAGGDDISVTVCAVDGAIIKQTTLSALLPESFGPDNVAEMQTKEDTQA